MESLRPWARPMRGMNGGKSHGTLQDRTNCPLRFVGCVESDPQWGRQGVVEERDAADGRGVARRRLPDLVTLPGAVPGGTDREIRRGKQVLLCACFPAGTDRTDLSACPDTALAKSVTTPNSREAHFGYGGLHRSVQPLAPRRGFRSGAREAKSANDNQRCGVLSTPGRTSPVTA